MTGDGFAAASTETLKVIRGNLLCGLDRVADAIADGTFGDVGPHGAAPPAQSGNLTLALLRGVEQELERREKAVARLPTAVLVDIDGTLATRITDRAPYEWQRVGEDAPVAAVITCVQALHAAGHTIIVMSGRDEECRRQTESWLTHHLLDVPCKELLMRRVKDNRRDDIVKKELYKRHVRGRYDVQFVLDDREQVVNMWRSLGLVCFQVAEGKF